VAATSDVIARLPPSCSSNHMAMETQGSAGFESRATQSTGDGAIARDAIVLEDKRRGTPEPVQRTPFIGYN
jgi:hypothetical protein